MDRNALASKRRPPGAQPTSRQPAHNARDKSTRTESPRQATTGKVKSAKSSNEIKPGPKRVEGAERPSVEDDPNTRHFTVANVGRNGTLYLKPSRMAPAQFAHALATPPATRDGLEEELRNEWPLQRRSSISGTYTPRPPRASAANQSVPMPPLSMANVHSRRRTRSHSFSTVDGSVRSPTFDANDFQILLNGRDASQRPKSSIDLTDGLLNLRIPHFRLGTPRFSERGTAYLHNSTYTSLTDDLRSSVFSRGEWDKLFPTPRAGPNGSTYFPRQSGSPYLHPSQAVASSRTPPTPTSITSDGISAAVYDKVEASINDPTLVRYSPATGRITAATPARLVSQITSPLFLDYELLADFFLTYRNFLSCRDLMEYLLARMKWALNNESDAGRIVRVRTFVAIRHWILNYFADDFLMDLSIRQRFCDLVNDLAQTLKQRADHGGTDMNVVGELKKCWRRTCAMFWPVPDAMDTSPSADIQPGQSQDVSAYGGSVTSLPLSVRRHTSAQMDFRRSSVIQLPSTPPKATEDGVLQAFGPDTETSHARTASIPTSPMSEQSLTVLSCSVPFLRHLKPDKDKEKEKSRSPRPAGPQRNPPHDKSARAPHGHKRSGSFSDALRDKRAPLPSQQPESVELQALPSFAMTGGLVRGLLLQPSPSKVDILIPLSPDLESREVGPGAMDSRSAHQRHDNAPMKKIVTDVRRAISRKGRHESPSSSHRTSDSSDSRNSVQIGQNERQEQLSAWQQLRGPPRVDRLGEKIESSYSEAFKNAPTDATQANDWQNGLPNSELNRLNSHVTTGSRSIVIMDATNVPDMPVGALPSVSSWASGMAPQPLFRNPGEAFEDMAISERPASGSPTAVGSDAGPGAEVPLHDLLAVPDSWKAEAQDGETATDSVQARKSSNVHPGAFDIPPARHQLKKRPGGDLKAADYVQDLEPAPRPYTGDSYSTFSQAITSGEPSRDLSGTHFSGHFINGLKHNRDQFSRAHNKDSVALLNTHSSQPNMRPSFEKQVSNLAQISSNQQDGGIEDALAKLEGKTSSLTASDSTAADPAANASTSKPNKLPKSSSMRAIKGLSLRNIDSQTVEAPAFSPQTDRQGASIYRLSGSDDDEPDQSVAAALSEQRSVASPISPRSYKFKPRKLASPALTKKSVATKASSTKKGSEDGTAKSEKWEEPKSAQGSFLLDDNESLSDISTELGNQSEDEGFGVRSFFFDDTVDDDGARSSVPFRGPPTPPSTEGPTASHSRERSPVMSPAIVEAKRPLKEASSAPKLMAPKPPTTEQPRPGELRRVQTTPSAQKSAHLPFVLAFDSDVIAEQMTIIEKDALDEVDWKDLIGLNWQQTPCQVRNWVEFLKSESNGIDIVIARFNLTVKWVVSECLLTEAPGERARCITKYISIATHCHRLRNYASMYQITLALLSSDISRLKQTWNLVPPASKTMLGRLEKLCQPVRNFYHLRSEMEAASTEDGCIPFIGLYTHDLMFNAQKPSLIDPTPPGKEKLINFERYQTAANIVKGLLRLIESSSKYMFRPHPEVLSRCLWLAALDDSELSSRSKTLET